MTDETHTNTGRETRKAPRIAVTIGAGLRTQGKPGDPATVIDISTDGFRAETLNPMPLGANVWLKLRGLETLYAKIVRVDGVIIGCEFATPLHPAVVERMIAAAAHAKP